MNNSSSDVNSSFESEVEKKSRNDNLSIEKNNSIKTDSQKKSEEKNKDEKNERKKNEQDKFNSEKEMNNKTENMLIFNDTENSKEKSSKKILSKHQSEKSLKNKELAPVRHNITINTIINNQINYITDSKKNNPFHLNLENMLSQQDKFASFMRVIFKHILSSNSMDQNYQKIHEIIKGNEHKYVDYLFPSNHINSLLKGYKHKTEKNKKR